METNLIDVINGANGSNGVKIVTGSHKTNGINRANGLNGVDNVNGSNEVSNTNGMNGANGVHLVNGNIDHSKHSDPLASTHSLLVYDLFKKLQDITRDGNVKVNGESLDIPTVVAVSKYNLFINLSIGPLD